MVDFSTIPLHFDPPMITGIIYLFKMSKSIYFGTNKKKQEQLCRSYPNSEVSLYLLWRVLSRGCDVIKLFHLRNNS